MEANINLVPKNEIENDDYQVDEAEFDALFQYYKTRTENENHTARLYTIFCILRVLLTLAPQSGYIHPDEFMQSIEVVGGMYLVYFLNPRRNKLLVSNLACRNFFGSPIFFFVVMSNAPSFFTELPWVLLNI